MNPSYEALLFVGVVAFYLFDSMLLLYSNEIVLIGSNARWSFYLANGHGAVRGRSPHVLHPFTPDRAVFRMTWSPLVASADNSAPENLAAYFIALRPLRVGVVVLALELFIVFPLVLFVLGTGVAFFVVVCTVYLSIVGLLVVAFVRREALGLTPTQLRGLCFDALACPPFAINVVRKITMHKTITAPPLVFAQRYFDASVVRKFAQALRDRVDEELEIEDDGSPRFAALQTFHARLTELTS